MITKEMIDAEIKELREQLGKAQEQFYTSQEQTRYLSETVERLKGAIIVSEKYLKLSSGDNGTLIGEPYALHTS